MIAGVIVLALGLLRDARADTPTCWSSTPPALTIGQPQDVIQQSIAFLLQEEAMPPHPYWPAGKSGVTIGVGWDIGQHTVAELASTWADLDRGDRSRLEAAAGITGPPAGALLASLKSLSIPASISRKVLSQSVRAEWYPRTLKIFPGAEALPAEVQVALVSVLFNRGPGVGREPDWANATQVDARWEIREIRIDVRDRDMFALYAHLDTMKRLWEEAGPRGVPLRRRAEGHLVKPYVDQQLQWGELQNTLKASGRPQCPP